MPRKKKEEEIEVIESSGNVYADLGYANPQEAMAKANLAILIADTIKKKKLTQKKAADLMGIDQPKVSAIIRGQLSGFTIDRLLRFLLALGIDIIIEAKPHRKRSEPGIIITYPGVQKQNNSYTGI